MTASLTSHPDVNVLEFASAARASLTRTPQGVDPWFHQYHGDLLDDRGLRTWTRAKQQLFSLIGGIRGRAVVDAGSGFGMVSNLMACWGASRVWAVEVHTPMIEAHRRVLDAHFRPIADRVHPVRADVSRLPLEDASADVVISIEAISHYFDVDAFLDECARVLRPGGFVVVSDGNNGANPSIRARTMELWQRFEAGPEGPFGEHVIPETMLARRVRVVCKHFPSLGPAEVELYAKATAGLDELGIVDAVRSHQGGGKAPAHYYQRGDCPREPFWGYWLERLFDPRDLARDLERRGFRGHALPHFGGASNDLVLAANHALRAFPTFRFARAFRVVGRKHG
ncbi:MAG: class I SAM-dependent methyltransferase [Candidatus Eisenbacteria bacterium]